MKAYRKESPPEVVAPWRELQGTEDGRRAPSTPLSAAIASRCGRAARLRTRLRRSRWPAALAMLHGGAGVGGRVPAPLCAGGLVGAPDSGHQTAMDTLKAPGAVVAANAPLRDRDRRSAALKEMAVNKFHGAGAAAPQALLATIPHPHPIAADYVRPANPEGAYRVPAEALASMPCRNSPGTWSAGPSRWPSESLLPSASGCVRRNLRRKGVEGAPLHLAAALRLPPGSVAHLAGGGGALRSTSSCAPADLSLGGSPSLGWLGASWLHAGERASVTPAEAGGMRLASARRAAVARSSGRARRHTLRWVSAARRSQVANGALLNAPLDVPSGAAAHAAVDTSRMRPT